MNLSDSLTNNDVIYSDLDIFDVEIDSDAEDSDIVDEYCDPCWSSEFCNAVFHNFLGGNRLNYSLTFADNELEIESKE